ncbi:MAG: xylose isomerase, partial [Pseudomonadota bacterium]
EPKPQEPSKHQYDFDAATCIGFLRKYGLEDEVKLNLEQGHAILAGHSFEHEIAVATSEGMLGSIDMNRNDYQSGWDTDQFPNNVPEVALAYYHILKAGGFTQGGTNFDAKLRRQSLDPQDLIAAHAGGMDVCARGLKAAAAMLEDGGLEDALADRYAGWDRAEAKAMLGSDLASITDRVLAEGINPEPLSGRQEILENYVNRFV